MRKAEVFPQKFVTQTPVLVVCIADYSCYKKNVAGLDDDNKIRAIRDLSIASSYLMLRATELGLGTCYIGWRDENKLKKVLKLNEEYSVPYVITIGYFDENKNYIRKRKNINEILTY